MIDQAELNRQLEERAAKRRERDIQDLLALLRHPELGPRMRRFCWRVMTQAGTFTSSFDPQSPHLTSFNEGQRKVGNGILGDIMAASTDAFAQMQREAVSQDTTDANWLKDKKKELEAQ